MCTYIHVSTHTHDLISEKGLSYKIILMKHLQLITCYSVIKSMQFGIYEG